MVWFTGTSTGNKYVVGALYERNGEKYRANVDGSFTKLSTGTVSKGSSQSTKVKWGGFASAPSKTATGQVGRSLSLQQVTQAAPPRAAVASPGAPTAGPGAAGATSSGVLGTISGSYELPEWAAKVIGSLGVPTTWSWRDAERTTIQVFGVPMLTNTGFSDAGDSEERYGELISDLVIGPLNLLADGFSTVTGYGEAWIKDTAVKWDAATKGRYQGIDPAWTNPGAGANAGTLGSFYDPWNMNPPPGAGPLY